MKNSLSLYPPHSVCLIPTNNETTMKPFFPHLPPTMVVIKMNYRGGLPALVRDANSGATIDTDQEAGKELLLSFFNSGRMSVETLAESGWIGGNVDDLKGITPAGAARLHEVL